MSAGKPDGPIPFRTILAFSLATAPVGALTTPLLVNLPKHYGTLGISLFWIATIFAAVRVLDIFVDPVVGMMMDRTRTRLGRYRVWLLASAPILMLGTWMLFFAAPGVSAAYLFVWLGVMYVGFSILVLSQVSWGAVLATAYDERSKVYAVGSVIGVLGAVAVLIAPILLKRTGPDAVHLMGWMILIALPVTALIVSVFTPEPLRIAPDAHRVSFRDFPALIGHHGMRRLLTADLLFTLGPAITSPLFLYFTQLLRGYTEAEAFLMLAAFSVAGLVGAPIWAWSAFKIGKHRSLMLAAVLYAIAQGTIPLIPANSFGIILPAMFVAGAILSAFAFLVRAMVADVADEIRLETGKDRIGVLYSLITSTAKIGTASAVFISLFLLGALGFNAEAGATNTPFALNSLLLIYTVPPVIMVLLAAWAVRGYSLSRERHEGIRAALAVKDAEALAAAPTP
ncbi:MAG: MFS transporter [Caulobacter sp.]|nr:MFS transporter [Caulobacter sp.]